ncbi:sclerostin domain-containing protein 1a [Hippoglossus hippoglossus]|uniref:sclerostin domain-containing protein 1a n=1 Tax=Hippoglossus hippoglossus TaxID=8267 RepID=UPI00148E8C1E|nr:sclerostin domain-containing protein 1a [Hippoglossus hippoglossus]
MQVSAHESLVLLCILLRSCQASRNHATELLFPPEGAPEPEVPSNVSLNRARTGGRGEGGEAQERDDRSQIGCRELRSTKYISDGHCTSINPIKELVCAGECLPAQMLQNWIGGPGGRKFWGRRSSGNQDWRCVNDKTRTQRIQLQCQDGSTRTYKITVVTSCKCKRYTRQHNESGHKFEELAVSPPQLVHKHKSKSKRRLGKNRLSENWHETEP